MKDYTKYSDHDLVTLLQNGDDGAFKEIYMRYDKLLYVFALKKLRDQEAAMDVVHDVFTWILNNRNTFTLKTSLSSYLYKSVLNRVFDIFRHQETIQKYVSEGSHYIEVDSNETDYLIREKDITALIKKEIAALPPRMREIYELRNTGNLTTKQIAEQLGLSEHTVSTQLKRALKQLRIKLGILVYVVFIINH